MSSTPIFDALLAEQAQDFHECSDKVFPKVTAFGALYKAEALRKARLAHPAQFMKPKPMAPRPGTTLTMGHDLAGDPKVVAFTDAYGVIHWVTT